MKTNDGCKVFKKIILSINGVKEILMLRMTKLSNSTVSAGNYTTCKILCEVDANNYLTSMTRV